MRCQKTELLIGASLYRQGGGICTNLDIPERLDNMSELNKKNTRI